MRGTQSPKPPPHSPEECTGVLQANAGRACAGNTDHTPSTNLSPSLELHLGSHSLPTLGFQHHPTGERSLPAQPPPENSTQRCHQDSHYPRKWWSVPWGAQYSCLFAFKSHQKCKNTTGGHGLAQARPRKILERGEQLSAHTGMLSLGNGSLRVAHSQQQLGKML